MIRFNTSGNQSFDRDLRSLYRRIDNLPEPLGDAFWLRFLQSLIERSDLRDALRAAMREQGANR